MHESRSHLSILLCLLTLGCATTHEPSSPASSCCQSNGNPAGGDPVTGDQAIAPGPTQGRSDEPDVALSISGQVHGTWAVIDDTNGESDVVFASYETESDEWTRQVRLNPTHGSAVAGRQVGPRIVTHGTDHVVVSWVDRGRDPSGDVVAAVSTDGGRLFSAPVRINDDDPGRETGQEYQDIAIAPDGTIYAVWLDERDAPASYPNQKQLYLAVSRDGGRSFEKNRRLTQSPNGVCPCCRPSVTTSANGSLHIVFRDREGESLFIRVLSKRVNEKSFSAPVTVSSPWKFPACPVNSPQITASGPDSVWVLWVDESSGQSELRWARSIDAARTFAHKGKIESPLEQEGAGAAHLTLVARPGTGSKPAEAMAMWETPMGQIEVAILPRDETDAVVTSFPVRGDLETLARSPALVASADSVGLCWLCDDPDEPPILESFSWRGLPLPEREGTRASHP